VEIGLHAEASTELEEAAAWYEARGLELGEELVEEVDRALETIAESPERWPLWPGVRPKLPVRRFLLPRYPFALPYVVRPDKVVVVAIAHTGRRPRYWLNRVQGP
jgi:plasmid stabilization system protein ParE